MGDYEEVGIFQGMQKKQRQKQRNERERGKVGEWGHKNWDRKEEREARIGA